MAHKYIIREATEADCEHIHRLITELAEFENGADQVTNTVKGLKEDGFGKHAFFKCLVAETTPMNTLPDEAKEDKDQSKEKRLILFIACLAGLKEDGFGKHAFFKCLVAETTPMNTLPDEAKEDKDQSKEKQVIGYVLYFFGYSTWNGKLVYLEDLYVTPDQRGAGVGTAMMKRVAKIGAEAGCNQIQWVVLGWNTGARKLYESIGAQNLTDTEDWHLMTLRHEKFDEFVKEDDETSSKNSILVIK